MDHSNKSHDTTREQTPQPMLPLLVLMLMLMLMLMQVVLRFALTVT
jgi:hypothetical protein